MRHTASKFSENSLNSRARLGCPLGQGSACAGFTSRRPTRGQAALCHRHEGPISVRHCCTLENWKKPRSGEWVRTFAVLTTSANELVARIHDRMPAILRRQDYERWLAPERDPHDVLAPFPAEPMIMWPASSRVNSPKNDDADCGRTPSVDPVA